jgi:hypothetical protein
MTESALPASQTPRVLHAILRHPYGPIDYKKPSPRSRRTTARPSERPDVHTRRPQKTNPGPIGPSRVPPTYVDHLNSTLHPHTHATHFIHRKLPIDHYVSTLKPSGFLQACPPQGLTSAPFCGRPPRPPEPRGGPPTHPLLHGPTNPKRIPRTELAPGTHPGYMTSFAPSPNSPILRSRPRTGR